VFRENLKVGLPGEVNYSITTTNGTEADPPVFFGRVVPMVGIAFTSVLHVVVMVFQDI